MAKNILEEIYGASGQAIGGMLAKQSKVKLSDLVVPLLASSYASGALNLKNDLQDSVDDLNKNLDRKLSKVRSTYNSANVTKNRNEYQRYSNATDRDSFLDERIRKRYDGSEFRRINGGYSYDELLKSKDKNLQNAFTGWRQGELVKENEYFTALGENPYVTKAVEDIEQVYIDEADSKIDALKGDRSNTSLFYKTLDNLFPKLNAANRVKLQRAIREASSAVQEFETNLANTRETIKNLYTSKPEANKDITGTTVYRPNVINQEMFKDIDKNSKDIIKNFDSLRTKQFNLGSLDASNNLQEAVTTKKQNPFRSPTKIIVQTYDPTTGKYVEDSNKSAVPEISSTLAKLVAIEQEIDKEAGGVPRSFSELVNDSLEQLVEDNYIVTKGNYMNKQIIFRKPVDLLGLEQAEIPEEMQKYINAVETDYTLAAQEADQEAPKLDLNTLVNDNVQKRINLITQDLETEQDPLRIEELNNERDRLGEIIKGNNRKLREEARIKLLFNPPKDLKGTMVVVGEHTLKAGELTEDQKNIIISTFNDRYTESQVLNDLMDLQDTEILEETDEDVLEEANITLSDEQLDELSNIKKQRYNSLQNNLTEINSKLENTDDLSNNEVLQLQFKRSNIIKELSRIVQGPSITFEGLSAEERKQKDLERDLRIVNNKLDNPDRYSPNELSDLQAEKTELQRLLEEEEQETLLARN